MALVVEDGTGLPNAESLASVAFIDAYHAARGNVAWAAIAAVETKEQLARKATDYLVYRYSGLWANLQLTTTQALPFPRTVYGLPLAIQQAVAELALIASTTPLTPNVTRGKKRVKVGPIEVEYDGNAETSTKFVAASLRIGPYLSGTSGIFARLVRT